MDPRGAEIIRLAKDQMRLPSHLRTDHWYNDWQHAVFIITFDHLMQALQRDRVAVADRLIDKLTTYLFVHFLCEEEGMAWAQTQGCLGDGKMQSHQALHLRFLDYWHEAIQRPFKTGALGGRRLGIKIQDFYDKVLSHIDDEDQTTYGLKTNRGEGVRLDEVAHIAQSGLPLSPNSPGALAVVAACNPACGRLLRQDALPTLAKSPLRRLTLAPAVIGAGDSVRARVLRANGLSAPTLLRLVA